MLGCFCGAVLLRAEELFKFMKNLPPFFRRKSAVFVGLLLALGTLSSAPVLLAQATNAHPATGARVEKDVSYVTKEDASEYERSRCKLDLYLPSQKYFPTIVWFHGGGLKEGNKGGDSVAKLAARLNSEGIALVSVNYRLSPKVLYPAYIQDAAAAVAWVSRKIESYGGDSTAVFVAGHSAGGYLAFMVGMDPHYLEEQGVKLSAIAGLIPVSGQVMTHYTVREERGIKRNTIVADEAAPAFHIRKGLPPMLVLYADHDMAGRAEENAYFVAMARASGNEGVNGHLAKDRNHGSIAKRMGEEGDPACWAIVDFIRGHTKEP